MVSASLPRFAVQSLLAGRHRSKLRGRRGLDFDEVRKYVAGDDIRNIDWRVTARVGKTHTKVFTEERERPVLLIIDQSSSMFFGSQVYLKSVIAAHMTALAAWRVLDVSDRVGGIVFNDEGMDFVKPKRDRRSVQRLLSLVVERNQELGPVSKKEEDKKQLNMALRHAVQVVSHDFLVVVISDFSQADDDVIKLFIQLTRHNDVIAAQIEDPLESELPDSPITVSDGFYQSLIEGRSRFRRQFSIKRKERQDWLSNQFKKYGVPYIRFNTIDPASAQLRKVLGGQIKARKRTR